MSELSPPLRIYLMPIGEERRLKTLDDSSANLTELRAP